MKAPERAGIGELHEIDDDATDALLASALRIAVMRLSRRLHAERNDETLGLSQLSALSTLWREGPLSPTALADHERIQPPSMTRVITALERRGLIEREPHPSDRRQSVIAITEAGEALVVSDRRRRQAWLANALDGLAVEDVELLRIALPVLDRLSRA